MTGGGENLLECFDHLIACGKFSLFSARASMSKKIAFWFVIFVIE